MKSSTWLLLGVAAAVGGWLLVRENNMGKTPVTVGPGLGVQLPVTGWHLFITGDYFGKDGSLYNAADKQYI